jgi:hypothetical protein
MDVSGEEFSNSRTLEMSLEISIEMHGGPGGFLLHESLASSGAIFPPGRLDQAVKRARFIERRKRAHVREK